MSLQSNHITFFSLPFFSQIEIMLTSFYFAFLCLCVVNATVFNSGSYIFGFQNPDFSHAPFSGGRKTNYNTFCELLGALCSSNILGDLDGKYLVKLNSFLVPVLQSSSRSRFVRCWRAKTDGWAASTFHRNCDGKGPTVTIIKVGSYIFGGYTDVSWSSK